MSANSKPKKLICVKCNTEIRCNEYLKCQLCLRFYDVHCTSNVSLKRFLLMTKENKGSWRCLKCSNSNILAQKGSSSSQISSSSNREAQSQNSENVTFRKKKAFEYEHLDSNFDSQESADDTIQSLPNMSMTEDIQVTELKSEIARLSLELASAHGEIDKLNENIVLITKNLDDKQKKIEMYKKILGDGGSILKSTPMKKQSKRLSNSKYATDSLFSPSASTPAKNAQAEIFFTPELGLTDEVVVGSGTAGDDDMVNYIQIDAPPLNYNTKVNQDHNQTSSMGIDIPRRKRELLIFSDDKCTSLRKYLQNHLKASYIVTSFVKPGATTDKLLESCVDLCKHFDKRDIVVFLCGQNDKKIMKLQASLYRCIENLTHTNVVLSDFRSCNNKNVLEIREMFKLLCMDFKNHSYFVHLDNRLTSYISIQKKLCKSLLSRIQTINYKYEYYSYRATNNDVHSLCNTVNKVDLISMGTQTEWENITENIVSATVKEDNLGEHISNTLTELEKLDSCKGTSNGSLCHENDSDLTNQLFRH